MKRVLLTACYGKETVFPPFPVLPFTLFFLHLSSPHPQAALMSTGFQGFCFGQGGRGRRKYQQLQVWENKSVRTFRPKDVLFTKVEIHIRKERRWGKLPEGGADKAELEGKHWVLGQGTSSTYPWSFASGAPREKLGGALLRETRAPGILMRDTAFLANYVRDDSNDNTMTLWRINYFLLNFCDVKAWTISVCGGGR